MTFKKTTVTTFLISIISIFLFQMCDAAIPALTNTINDLEKTSQNLGYKASSTIQVTIAKSINYIFTFLGIIFLVLIVISGVQWLMAQGKDEETKKAKARIQDAIIGLTIVLCAYVITNTILPAILDLFKTTN